MKVKLISVRPSSSSNSRALLRPLSCPAYLISPSSYEAPAFLPFCRGPLRPRSNIHFTRPSIPSLRSTLSAHNGCCYIIYANYPCALACVPGSPAVSGSLSTVFRLPALHPRRLIIIEDQFQKALNSPRLALASAPFACARQVERDRGFRVPAASMVPRPDPPTTRSDPGRNLNGESFGQESRVSRNGSNPAVSRPLTLRPPNPPYSPSSCAFWYFRGSQTVKVVPSPSLLVASTRPW